MTTTNNTAAQVEAISEHFPELKETARRAFYWVSFNPEGRGDRIRQEFGEILINDIDYLRSNGATDDQVESYKDKYKKLFVSWLHASSRCASSVITGGSGFNVRRADKANRSEHRHYEIFKEWRERAKKGILKANRAEKTYLSEIERYEAELEGMKINHEKMKEANKRIKTALKNGTDITDYLTSEFGIKPHMIEWTLKFGFGLSNNNANMKRVEQRIKELKAKEAQRMEEPEKSYTFEGGQIIFNYEADRIQVKHDQKPTFDKIQELKKSGFKWSPSNGVWQRQITANAIWTTKRLFSNIQKAN
jgi:hypothetical protein